MVEGDVWLADGSLCRTELFSTRYSRQEGGASQSNIHDRRTETEKDKDRVGYSTFLQRLAGVTQVTSPTLKRGDIHNRLTHSLKVSWLARELANDQLRMARDDTALRDLILDLGGLDMSACETAGLAHDLGHAPFGHAAGRLLDAWVRELEPSADGFEGNAQTTRVLTRLDDRKVGPLGLGLTAVTLAGTMKYPWTKDETQVKKSEKFSVYQGDLEHLEFSRNALPPELRDTEHQTLEASFVDLADDITYAIHDVQDFYLAGLLDLRQVNDDLKSLSSRMNSPGYVPPANPVTLSAVARFERSAHRLAENYPEYFTVRDYVTATIKVIRWLSDHLPARHDQTALGKAYVREAFSRLISDICSQVAIARSAPWTNGPFVTPGVEEWHKLQVLKSIAQAYVIESPLVALHEQAQLGSLRVALGGLLVWVQTPKMHTLPQPLASYLAEVPPQGDAGGRLSDCVGVRRAIIDYVCGLTDDACHRLAEIVGGSTIPYLS